MCLVKSEEDFLKKRWHEGIIGRLALLLTININERVWMRLYAQPLSNRHEVR